MPRGAKGAARRARKEAAHEGNDGRQLQQPQRVDGTRQVIIGGPAWSLVANRLKLVGCTTNMMVRLLTMGKCIKTICCLWVRYTDGYGI